MIDYKKYLTKQNIVIISLIGAMLFTAILAIYFSFFYSKESVILETENKSDIVLAPNNDEEIVEDTAQPEYIYVDIKGEVTTPGVYYVPKDDRIIDVIKAAGGITKNASTELLNLSQKLVDEMIINVFSKTLVKEIKNSSKEVSVNCTMQPVVTNNCDEVSTNSESNSNSNNTNTNSNNNTLISINTATINELMQLSGIGEAKARDIIAYREANGSFKSIDEIKNVSGIGDSSFAKIKDYITI